MRSLRWKLIGALVLIVVVSMALMTFISNRNIKREFEQYVCQCNTTYCEDVTANLASFYANRQSWVGLQDVLTELVATKGSHFIVTDTSGAVVGDTEGKRLGENISRFDVAETTAIVVSDQKVGYLYTITLDGVENSVQDNCKLPIIGSAEQEMLDRTHRSLLITGIISGAVAFVLGLILTRQMTSPIRALTAGARHVGLGDLSHRVKVNTRDELEELAKSFNSMTSQLEASEEARRRFTADVAHELRTPLTIIEGTTNGILDGVFASDTEHISLIKQQTALLTRLISDLRDLSLAESGQLKLERLPTNLASLLSRNIGEAEVAGREKGIHFNINIIGKTDKIMVDPVRLGQVITNLISNAIRHTPVGGRITVSLKTVASDAEHGTSGRAAIISVADTGEGINPEHLPHVFERFYRTQDSRTRKEGGTGLGLAIVKQMVQAHGGHVWVESKSGKGSTFYLSLPYAVE